MRMLWALLVLGGVLLLAACSGLRSAAVSKGAKTAQVTFLVGGLMKTASGAT